MRHTEFWDRMDTALGKAYARTFAEQFVIADLGSRTVQEALADGYSPKEVWRAVHTVLELPPNQR